MSSLSCELDCVRESSFTILINSSPIEWFSSTIGLCKGCILSLYLFVLLLEVLFRALKQEQRMIRLIGIGIDNAGNSVTRLLFANDCFIVFRVLYPKLKF